MSHPYKERKKFQFLLVMHSSRLHKNYYKILNCSLR
jgi:hypothetical protein